LFTYVFDHEGWGVEREPVKQKLLELIHGHHRHDLPYRLMNGTLEPPPPDRQPVSED
jgi:hypothetical protein